MEMILRTKSANQLTDANTVATIEQVLSHPNASEKVFFALHSPEECCEEFGLSYSGEAATVFANELRYQFNKTFPEQPLCFEVAKDTPFNSEESMAFRALLNVVPSAFVAYRILEAVYAYSFLGLKAIERAGFLLRSKAEDYPMPEEGERSLAERNWFGGLREIFSNKAGDKDYSFSIATMLKPYHEEISKLFDELMMLKFPTSYNQPKEEPITHSPEPTPTVAIETDTPQTEPTLVEAPAENTATTAAISPESILANTEAIRHFLAYAKKLRNAGVSPNALLQKEDSVMDFLKASKTLMA